MCRQQPNHHEQDISQQRRGPAGTRAVQALRPVFLAVKGAPVLEAVCVPHVSSLIGGDGIFTGNDVLTSSATAMLDELARREAALRVLRDAPWATRSSAIRLAEV